MEAQAPAEGIMAMKGGNRWRWYRVPCECGCDAEVNISVEIDDPDDGLITCHVSTQVKTAWWREAFPVTYNENWIVLNLKHLANRWISTAKICWTAVTKGYVELESYTLLTPQQALNLSTVLQKSIKEMEAEQVKRAKSAP